MFDMFLWKTTRETIHEETSVKRGFRMIKYKQDICGGFINRREIMKIMKLRAYLMFIIHQWSGRRDNTLTLSVSLSLSPSLFLTNLQVGILIPVSWQRMSVSRVGPGTDSGTSRVSYWIYSPWVGYPCSVSHVVLGLPRGLVLFT